MAYQALVLENEDQTQVKMRLATQELPKLNDGQVQIEIVYSSINYKDALACLKPKSGVIGQFPMIPGIDLAGKVTASYSQKFKKGDSVLVTGYDLGIKAAGGFAEFATVPDEWVIKCPDNLTLKEAMSLGTAGFTAGLSILEFLETKWAEDKATSILITGATGGVGSIALNSLHQMGYTNLTVLTRQTDPKIQAYLTDLGATTILHPGEFSKSAPKLLGKQQYGVVIDPVGGEQLSHLIPQLKYNGYIFLSGNAGGIKLETNVLPFILRGVHLFGIDSVYCEKNKRQAVWDLLSGAGKIEFGKFNFSVIPFTKETIEKASAHLLSGQKTGRYLIEM